MLLPKNEKRLFETGILPNGIKCIYIEDPELDKTSIAVTINAGSLSEPKEFMGLAHFLEHMLFMGSSKYPVENYYETMLNKYGGSANAYTADLFTCYFFSIFNEGLKDILDVFTQFFIEPLFNIESINREINAVNSEHQKNINSDIWRLQQILHNLSIKDNMFNTFTTGSFDTLKREDNNMLRESMIDFYKEYYVSNNIGLCIISKLKIKEQKKIINKSFGLISNKKGNSSVINKPLYDIKNITYQMIPLTENQILNYFWEIPNNKDKLNIDKTKIFEIIGRLIADSSKKSLETHLKNLGLVDYVKYNCDSDYGLFSVRISLTKKGLDNINIVDGCMKHAMKIILDKYLVNNIEKIMNYYKQVYRLTFDYGAKDEPLDLCLLLSNNIHNYKLDNIIEEIALITKNVTNMDIIQINKYFKDCFKILICKKEFSKLTLVDKYYSTKYGVIENIDYPIVKFDFHLDFSNPYLNIKPKLIKNLDCNIVPTLVDTKVWYGSCSNFNETTIKTCYIFSSNKFFDNVLNSLLTSISVKYLEHYLYTELNNVFALNYNIDIIENTLYNNIVINYSCPNDIVFYKKFIDKTFMLIKNINEKDIVNEIIVSLINRHIEIFQNVNIFNPWEYASYYFNNITIENNYTIEDNINMLKKIKAKDIIHRVKDLFNNVNITTIHYGNLHVNDIYKNGNIISKDISYKFPKFTFPESKNISIHHPNPFEKNNCVTIYYYVGIFTPIRFLCNTIVNNIIKDEFFNVLRTQKQLGYLVNFSLSKTRLEYYFVEKIQSSKSCDIILKEILEFNKKIISYVEKCDIAREKMTAKQYLEEKENSLYDYYSKYSSEIVSKEYMFDRSKLVLKQLESITKQLLIDTVNNYILNNSNMCIINIMGNT